MLIRKWPGFHCSPVIVPNIGKILHLFVLCTIVQPRMPLLGVSRAIGSGLLSEYYINKFKEV